MAGLEPSQTPEQEPSLLESYARSRQQRHLKTLFMVGVSLLILAGATLYEYGTRGTSYLLAVESAIIATILAIGLLLALSGVVFGLSWNFAQCSIDRGETRPVAKHIVCMIIYSILAALPLATILGIETNPGQAVLAFIAVFWVTASCSVFAYLARFAASGKRLW